MIFPSTLRPPCLAVLLLSLFSLAAASAQEPAAQLSLAKLSVEPKVIRAETLCKLSVEVTNTGSSTADAFAFDVLVGGEKLTVYESQLFLDPVKAGETRRLKLFNFWSSETGRELPAQGALTVEVRLREARWVRIEEVESEQVWTSLGSVEGLPQSASARVEIER